MRASNFALVTLHENRTSSAMYYILSCGLYISTIFYHNIS